MRSRHRALLHLVIAFVLVVLVAGCRATNATPTLPAVDFGGIEQDLARHGVTVSSVVSGDAGCADPNLIPTAISFRAAGLDQAQPVTAHLYIFGSQSAYDRLRQSVDACAASYVKDPAGLVSLDAAPYVLVGQGPWATQFVAALRTGLEEAAAGH